VTSAVEVRYRCPCCGSKTLEAPAALKLCPVCWWDDASDVRLTVNGQLSLKEARVNYAQFGAAHPRYLSYVRKPLPTEK
jgi:Zn finger protein HypA/HybF involved in hydrogenase expression